jgi:FKBP-type peptidyl-prolyl cis-trans isomerase 2
MEGSVTLDGNHPLAGLDLTFALRLDRIEEPRQ